jgi:hypothetical protein
MAERTPARKPKRGPTKAAALKALGLTQEDLDYIKDRNAPPQTHEASDNSLRGDWLVREEKVDPTFDQSDEDPVWYMRNLRGVDVGFRLSRQSDSGKKRTNLKPRGQRGDMQKLEPGDLKDSELKTQVAYGLIEVIPEGEALEALKKQYTNVGTQVPAHIALLRNERGEEYKTPVRTVTDEEAMGYKVADLNPDLMSGKLSDREIKRDGGFAQDASRTPTGGNPAIISDGFMAPVQSDGSGDNERAAEVDAKIRANAFEGPADAIGVAKVTVEPTQRVQ